MNVRQQKRIIGLAAGLATLSGLAVLAAGFLAPVSPATNDFEVSAAAASSVVPSVESPAGKPDADSQTFLAELQRLSAMDLRKPLQGENTSNPSAGSSLAVSLVGTINESDHSMALLKKRDGSVKVCAVGQSIEDAGGKVTVTKIEPRKVTVLFNDESYDLVLPPVPGKVGQP